MRTCTDERKLKSGRKEGQPDRQMDGQMDRWTGWKGEKERNEESKDLTYRIEFNALFLHEITIRVPQLLENDRLRERERRTR